MIRERKNEIYGKYPQMRVEDNYTIDRLNDLAGPTPNKNDNHDWINYRYFVKNQNNHSEGFMFYKDIELDGSKYRGVFVKHNRPNTRHDDFDVSYNKNIYEEGKTYWFIFQPIEWRVLSDSSEGKLLQSVKVLDAQDYNSNKDNPKNDFEESSLKEWLNETFYDDAFSEEEQKRIIAKLTDSKVKILSLDASQSYNKTTEEALAYPSDYAKIQGCVTNYKTGHVAYWLRETMDNPNFVYFVHNRPEIRGVEADSIEGVRPIIWIASNLSKGQFVKHKIELYKEDDEVGLKYKYGIAEKHGHPFITPDGKYISDKDYIFYLDLILGWAEKANKSEFEKLNIVKENIDNITLRKLFDLLSQHTGSENLRDFLNKRGLAFVFVVSYHIQKRKDEFLSPYLAKVYYSSLMRWLPVSKVAHHYLDIMCNNNHLEALRLLTVAYTGDDYFSSEADLLNIKEDLDKAVYYADKLYHSPLNEHVCDRNDLYYSKALFKKDVRNADHCLDALNHIIHKYWLESDEDESYVILDYIIFELEIASKVKSPHVNLDFDEIEGYLLTLSDWSDFKVAGLYWLAKCYLAGLNCEKNARKAEYFLKYVMNSHASYIKKSGAVLATIKMDGIDCEIDYEEANNIVDLAMDVGDAMQWDKAEGENELIDVLLKVNSKTIEGKYIRFLRRILQEPIHSVNDEVVEEILKKYLSEKDFNYLMNDYNESESSRERTLEIFRALRHPSVSEKLRLACNQLIYVGTDETGYDNYLNFEQSGNIFVHGTVGSGKTWYFYSTFKRLKEKERYKALNFAVWSFKPFEFEKMFGKCLYEDAHEYLKAVLKMSEDETRQTVAFIDELSDFKWKLNEEDMILFKSLLGKNNITFICNSQIMNTLIDEFSSHAKTRICMMCYKKAESTKMIGIDDASTIKKYGNMYVLNPSDKRFLSPKKMKIIYDYSRR